MPWIYLSPHFDDVALSCGGLVWQQAQAGEPVSIWTVCAGGIPAGRLSPFAQQLHARWQAGEQAPEERRAEDLASCRRMGATCLHFPVPDCIYRQGPDGEFLYPSEESLWGPVHPQDEPLAGWLAGKLAARLQPDDQLVCPLTLGRHVDHQLTRLAAERLERPVWFYADYPYVLKETTEPASPGCQAVLFPISEQGLQAWAEAVAAHASQISSFWPGGLEEMRRAIQAYRDRWGGVRLLRAR